MAHCDSLLFCLLLFLNSYLQRHVSYCHVSMSCLLVKDENVVFNFAGVTRWRTLKTGHTPNWLHLVGLHLLLLGEACCFNYALPRRRVSLVIMPLLILMAALKYLSSFMRVFLTCILSTKN